MSKYNKTMGKQSRRVRFKDTSMTTEKVTEGQKRWKALKEVENIHHSLNIDEKYKRLPSWIALEKADEEEDWDTFNKIFDLQNETLYDHIAGTMPCFKWKFYGNEPVFKNAPWKKGECYEQTTMVYNDKKKTTEFIHCNKIN